jgi:chorismate mutase/prephenate dehydratase
MVAYLGPEATFSHQAASSFYGKSASFKGTDSIEDVFDLVEKGGCHQGITPIENSYEGSVNITLDMLFKYDLRIFAEIFLRIRHNLLGSLEAIGEIERLYSHPMPIAQCRLWLKSNLHGVPVTQTASSSLAAKMAAEKPGAAAIGSKLAGRMYGLNIVVENIEDHPDNVTRFFVIGKTRSKPTGKDKSSILFSLSHRPGALYQSLSVLAERNVNMTRIESRPMKTRNWEYLFFVDIEGHEEDGNIGSALKEMEKHCAFMKILGSYPVGGEPLD